MSLKAKFGWNDNRLVVPIRHLKQEKVARLLNDVYERFRREFGLSADNRFITIRTADGYSLNLNDTVEDVVSDGDCFVLVDYSSWMKEHTSHCNKDWISVEHVDLVDEITKWAGVGVHGKNGQLYIRLGKGNSVTRLDLFTQDELTQWAKPGKHLVSQLTGAKNGSAWSVDAYLVVEGQTVVAVELGVKTMSSPTAEVKRVALTRDDGKLVAGEVKTLSDATVHVIKSVNPRLPQPKSQGPVTTMLPVLPEAPLMQSTGDSPVTIKQSDKIVVQQQWANEDKIPHTFYTEVLVSNNTDKKVNFVKLKAEYKNAAGAWEEIRSWVGYKSGNWDYRSYNADIVPVNEQSSEKLVFIGEIRVPGLQYDRERRAMKSLPQPLEFRYTWTDSENKSAVLETSFVNPPLSVPTKESVAKYDRVNIVDWAECDDTAAETKIYGYGALNDEGTEYRIKVPGTYSTLTNDYLRRVCWKAARENTPEVDVTSWESKGTWSIDVKALVDLEHKQLRGFKVALKTSTSTAEYYWPCPELKEK